MQELVSSSPPASAASECFCEQADKENCMEGLLPLDFMWEARKKAAA